MNKNASGKLTPVFPIGKQAPGVQIELITYNPHHCQYKLCSLLLHSVRT